MIVISDKWTWYWLITDENFISTTFLLYTWRIWKLKVNFLIKSVFILSERSKITKTTCQQIQKIFTQQYKTWIFTIFYKILLHLHRQTSISMRLTVHEPATTLNGVYLICILKKQWKEQLTLRCKTISEASQWKWLVWSFTLFERQKIFFLTKIMALLKSRKTFS